MALGPAQRREFSVVDPQTLKIEPLAYILMGSGNP